MTPERIQEIIDNYATVHAQSAARLSSTISGFLDWQCCKQISDNQGRVALAWHGCDATPVPVTNHSSSKIQDTTIRFVSHSNGDVLSHRQFVRFAAGPGASVSNRPIMTAVKPALMEGSKSHVDILSTILRDCPSLRSRGHLGPKLNVYVLDGGGGADSLLRELLEASHDTDTTGITDMKQKRRVTVENVWDIPIVIKCVMHVPQKAMEWGCTSTLPLLDDKLLKSVWATCMSGKRCAQNYGQHFADFILLNNRRVDKPSVYLKMIDALGLISGGGATAGEAAARKVLTEYNVGYNSSGGYFEIGSNAYEEWLCGQRLTRYAAVEIGNSLLHINRWIVATWSRWLTSGRSSRRVLSSPYFLNFVDYLLAKKESLPKISYDSRPFKNNYLSSKPFFARAGIVAIPAESIMAELMENDLLLKQGRVEEVVGIGVKKLVEIGSWDAEIWDYMAGQIEEERGKFQTETIIGCVVSLSFINREMFSFFYDQYPGRLFSGPESFDRRCSELLSIPKDQLRCDSIKLQGCLRLPHGKQVVQKMVDLAGESACCSIVTVEQAHSEPCRMSRKKKMSFQRIANVVLSGVFLKRRHKLDCEKRRVRVQKRLEKLHKKNPNLLRNNGIFLRRFSKDREKRVPIPSSNKKAWYSDLMKEAAAAWRGLSSKEQRVYAEQAAKEGEEQHEENRVSIDEAELEILSLGQKVEKAYGHRMTLRNTRPDEEEVQRYILAHFCETLGDRNQEQLKIDDNLRRDTITAKTKASALYSRVMQNRMLRARQPDSEADGAEVLIAKNRECFHRTVLKFHVPGHGQQCFLYCYSKKSPRFQVNLVRIVRPVLAQKDLAFLNQQKISSRTMEDNAAAIRALTSDEVWLLRPDRFFYGDMRVNIPAGAKEDEVMVVEDVTIDSGLKVCVPEGSQFISLPLFLERWKNKFGDIREHNEPAEAGSSISSRAIAGAKTVKERDDELELDEDWIGKDVFALEAVKAELKMNEEKNRRKEATLDSKHQHRHARGRRTDEDQDEWWAKLRSMKEEDAVFGQQETDVDAESEEVCYFSGPDLATEKLETSPSYYTSRILLSGASKRLGSWASYYRVPRSCSAFFTKFSRGTCHLICTEYQKKVQHLYGMWDGSPEFEYPAMKWELSRSLVLEAEKEGKLKEVIKRLEWGPARPKAGERLNLEE